MSAGSGLNPDPASPESARRAPHAVPRRQLLRGAVAGAALAWINPAQAFGLPAPGDEGKLVPFLDAQPVNPKLPMVQWDALTSWITPEPAFFAVQHYSVPSPLGPEWKLELAGLVENPSSFSLDALKARPKKEFVAALECSGNGSSPGFMGGIGNGRWTGTPLAPILIEAGLRKEAVEVIFYGADQGVEKIRSNEYPQTFARSLSAADAISRDDILLGYQLNGQPLPHAHGAPVRLIVPGWYGVAWVKWLTRVEVTDRRFMGRFMARDYVTIRGEKRGDETIWRETSVSRMNLKSLVARVVRLPGGDLRITGAAWNDGTPLKAVELKIDDGAWVPVTITDGSGSPYAWKLWSYDWKNPQPGEHSLVSRATDAAGKVQPAADDPVIALKKTYWEANQQWPRKIRL